MEKYQKLLKIFNIEKSRFGSQNLANFGTDMVHFPDIFRISLNPQESDSKQLAIQVLWTRGYCYNSRVFLKYNTPAIKKQLTTFLKYYSAHLVVNVKYCGLPKNI